MNKIPFDIAKDVLLASLSEEQAVELLKKMESQTKQAEEEEDGEEKEVKPKNQLVIVLSDPHGILPPDMTGWIVQIPESMAPSLLPEKIAIAASDFHKTKKGRKFKLESIGDAFERVPAKIFKSLSITNKTKMPVWAVPIQALPQAPEQP